MRTIRRREFIAGLGGAAAWPLAARAQQPSMPVIGFLSGASAEDNYKNYTVPFLQGLQETGYVVGQMRRLNTAGRKINSIGCRRLQPISFAAALRSS